MVGNGFGAGTPFGGFLGDGDSAISCELYFPCGVAVDKNMNLFIADVNNQRIRKVSNKGIISTVAGNGTQGYDGDGGSATVSKLNNPFSVAVDAEGNIYIADRFNNVIRKVDTNGIINTVAGNGIQGDSGDGDSANAAKLNRPFGVAVDVLGNLYIADTYNNRIRKVNNNGIISTVAGNGYVNTQTGYGGYSGDGGNATAAKLNNPYSVSVDSYGNLYIADVGNNRIRKVTFSTLPVTLSSFTAIVNNKTIQTNWETATELNTSHFIMQHSSDGTSFTDIGTVNAIGIGANSYDFTNYNPANGMNYYRLQIVDKYGSSTYSKVVSVNFGDKQSFSIIPNPARDFATISFSKTVDKATIAVYDITGKVVITQSLIGSANSYKLNTQTLTNGVYVIKVNTATGSYNEKLLINK